jgi:hypothetical protein
MMRVHEILLAAAALSLGSCAAANSPNATSDFGPAAVTSPAVARRNLYQPLAVGDSWTYTCRDIKGGGENNGNPFTIYDKVLGTVKVGRQNFSEFSLQVPQVPSKPLKIDTQIMLLTNAPNGDLWLRGYLVSGKLHVVKVAKIVSAATPQKGAKFGYEGPNGKPVSRIFCCIEQTNRTPLGIFTVAAYQESANTHDYGYAKGTGIAEEDHGPNYEVDCLIKAVTLH